jgi:hypothetical protein
VQGKRSYTFTLEDGRKVKGSDLVQVDNWSWRQSLHAPGCRYVRLRARSRTYGQVLPAVLILEINWYRPAIRAQGPGS